MALFELFPQVLVGKVGVNLGGGDTGVSQQGLHMAKAGAASKHVGGKAVAQGVGCYVLFNATLFGVEIPKTQKQTRDDVLVLLRLAA